MSITMKLISSVIAFVVGSIIYGVIKDLVGAGQYIVAGVIVLILFTIWSRPSVEKINENKGKNK